MKHHLGNSGKPVWDEWHRRRQEALRLSRSIVEFSDPEIVKFNLGTAAENPTGTNPYPLAITGELADETWMLTDAYSGKPYDVRETDERI
jgi:hypothetical protein